MPLSNISCLVSSSHLWRGELKRNRPRSYLLSHFGNGNALGAEKERQVSVREINRGDSGLVLYLGAMGDNRQISRLVLLEVTI